VIEALKETVADIPKYPNRPETIRVSVFRVGESVYADLRVYLRGRPTHQGLVIHRDMMPAVLDALRQAVGRAGDYCLGQHRRGALTT
jgi:hypothetical protein